MTDHTAEHAHLSPSGSHRWFTCAGSLVLEAPIPNRPNDYSDEGTACHAVAAWCLTEHWRASKRINELIPVHRPGEEPRYVQFTDEMADMVQGAVDTIRRLTIGAHVVMIEQKLDFTDALDLPPEVIQAWGRQFGTGDVVIVTSDYELVVADFKFGHTPVEVVENSQLLIYAVAAHDELSLGYEIKRGRLMILQPKARGVTEWAFDLEYLERFRALMRSKAISAVNAWRDQDTIDQATWEETYLNPKPNDRDCAFCRAMATCPSAQRYMQETVGADFQAIVDDPKGALPEVSSDPAVAPDKWLATMMDAAPFAEDFFTAVRAETERRLLQNIDSVPGYGLELGRKGNRRFKDEAEAEHLIHRTWKIKRDIAYNYKLKTPTALEKLTKPSVATDEDGKEIKLPPILGPRRWKTLQDMIVQNDPSPSVKRRADIKNLYSPKPLTADDFDDLT
jgi:hypothetical protein